MDKPGVGEQLAGWVLAARAEGRVKAGDLWQLGEHRLLCGDATDAAHVNSLLSGRCADLAVIDPPYNVDYGSSNGAATKRRRAIKNDSLAPADWERFVRSWAGNLLPAVEGHSTFLCRARSGRPSAAFWKSQAGTGRQR